MELRNIENLSKFDYKTSAADYIKSMEKQKTISSGNESSCDEDLQNMLNDATKWTSGVKSSVIEPLEDSMTIDYNKWSSKIQTNILCPLEDTTTGEYTNCRKCLPIRITEPLCRVTCDSPMWSHNLQTDSNDSMTNKPPLEGNKDYDSSICTSSLETSVTPFKYHLTSDYTSWKSNFQTIKHDPFKSTRSSGCESSEEELSQDSDHDFEQSKRCMNVSDIDESSSSTSSSSSSTDNESIKSNDYTQTKHTLNILNLGIIGSPTDNVLTKNENKQQCFINIMHKKASSEQQEIPYPSTSTCTLQFPAHFHKSNVDVVPLNSNSKVSLYNISPKKFYIPYSAITEPMLALHSPDRTANCKIPEITQEQENGASLHYGKTAYSSSDKEARGLSIRAIECREGEIQVENGGGICVSASVPHSKLTNSDKAVRNSLKRKLDVLRCSQKIESISTKEVEHAPDGNNDKSFTSQDNDKAHCEKNEICSSVQDITCCAVCGGLAFMAYYGAHCCGKCRAYFRKIVLEDKKSYFDKVVCKPAPNLPEGCKHCFYYRCLNLGLDPAKVVEEASERHIASSKSTSNVFGDITPIFIMDGLHHAYVTTFKMAVTVDATDTQIMHHEGFKSVVKFFFELLTTSHHKFLQFSQKVPGFDKLVDDRRHLANSSSLYMFVLHIVSNENFDRDRILFPDGRLVNLRGFTRLFGEFMNDVENTAEFFCTSQVDFMTTVLLMAIGMLTDRPGLQKPLLVKKLYVKMLEALRHHISKIRVGHEKDIFVADLLVQLGTVHVIAAKLLHRVKQLARQLSLFTPVHLLDTP